MVTPTTPTEKTFLDLLNDPEETAAPAVRAVNPFDQDEIIVRQSDGTITTLHQKSAPIAASRAIPVAPPAPSAFDQERSRVSQDVDQRVQAVVSAVSLELSPELKKRLENIIRSRIKGIRNTAQTRQMLLSSPAEAGVGLTAEQVNLILRKIDGGATAPAPETKTIAPVTPPTLIEAPQPETPRLQFNKPTPTIAPPKPEPPTPPASPRRPQPSFTPSRPKIADVKFKPKLTGPVQELATMSLEQFRRLAPNPAGATEKVVEKITLLEEESFPLKIAGINAWKESPVNQLYVEIGRQSIEQKVPIATVIAQAGTLTEEEFDAIADLNTRLRH